MRLHQVRAEARGNGAAPVKVVHQPGIIAGEAGPALLAPFGRRAAGAGNVRALTRAVDFAVAQAPQTGGNAQAQG
ncbi:hypothetical protein PJL18_04403 [Paenarthrobacter nicotinovorans]|nr:hypothetical protein [Paenarthrobacter nicotinovorans]